MPKKMWFLAALLGIVLLISGCAAPGSGVSLMDAQNAFAAVILMGIEGAFLQTGGIEMVPPVNGPSELKHTNIAGTLLIDLVPKLLTPPSTSTTTATGYIELNSGYLISGTVVEVRNASSYYTGTYNLSLSHPAYPVKTITGALVGPISPSSGTLYFNGVAYTYAQLMGL